MAGRISKSKYKNKSICLDEKQRKLNFSTGQLVESTKSLVNERKTPIGTSSCLVELEEIEGDLFGADENVSLAHCVSADMNMGKGIAKLFKEKFQSVNELKSQNVQVGGCAYLKINEKFIFYLVTKERYNYKPTYETISSSLNKMKEIIEKNDVKSLAMPLIGCGLDKLLWPKVKKIILDIFKFNKLKITIYKLPTRE